MKGMSIEDRAINLAHYIIDSKDTVRGTAKKFGISKSTVHTEVTLKNGRNKLTSKTLLSSRQLYGCANWTSCSRNDWNKEGFSNKEKSSCEVRIGNKIDRIEYFE